LRTHGWKRKYYPDELGYNSRLDALQAAILLVKLRYLDSWNDRRRQLAHRYIGLLTNMGIGLPYERPPARHVYHLFVIRLKNRDRVQRLLREEGIASEVYYPQPLHLTKPCRHLGYETGSFPVSEQASRETLAIPLYPELSYDQFDSIVDALARALKK
jgi:dTDP-4-amino-4,6-dideoxygalactose transaminase